MNQTLLGAIAMSSLIAGLFFLRFWKRTGDRFFLFFAISFVIEGLNRAVLGMTSSLDEELPFFYIVRLVSFILIIIAIVDKNRSRKSRSIQPESPE